jgi:hypothetical protein
MGKPAIARILAGACRSAGLEVTTAAVDDLAQPGWWDALDAAMVVLPDARRVPAAARAGLLAYLHRGGKLLCAGAPLMGEPLFRIGSGWLTAGELAEKRQAIEPRHLLLKGDSAETALWPRSSNNPRAASRLSVEPTDHGPALRLDVQDLRDWDNIGRSYASLPFLEGDTLTSFWARSERPADVLAVEWQEQDGSRWIAAVPLTRTWHHFVLRPVEFAYWPDNPMGPRRGGGGDRFHPERAARLILGFAFSHQASAGDHTAWVAGLGTAPDPFAEVDTGFEPPPLEALSPAYELYPLRPAVRCQTLPAASQSATFTERTLTGTPARAWSPIPRHPGIGLADRPARLIPLIRAVDTTGADRGAVAWMTLHAGEPFPRSAWLVVGTTDEAFWTANRATLSALLARAVQRLARGVFLAAGGADRFTAYAGEPVRAGARIANFSSRPAVVRMSILVVREPSIPGTRPAFRQAKTVSLAPHQIETVDWQAPPLAAARYGVRVMLRGDVPGTEDALSHALIVIGRPRVSDADPITVRQGHFRLHGRRWFALGVNFWPRYSVGREVDDNQQHWLDPALYDPTVVEQDLNQVRAMGMNCVSVQYTNPRQALTLRDLLRRCQEQGLRVNLYLSGAHPLRFDPPLVRRLMESADLAHQPALFAYDVAWEPVWGRQEERRRFDADWRAWVLRRYGGMDRAEAAWRCAANRDPTGQASGPSDEQVTHDGLWRRMVADYRRFQDDELNARYARVRQLVHSIDPHHLIGARTGWGGGPFVNEPAMPFDHSSGAAPLDFISPEGWNLRGESIERGAFIPAYDRMVSGGKPVFWAEFGDNCGYPLGGITGEGDETEGRRRLQQQADQYDRFYRMVRLSDSDGAMAWWLPGGYRVDERSDYGILNPDRTLRPAGAAVQSHARELLHPVARPAPDTWLTVDRFADARGAAALWQKEAGDFARMVREGHRVGLKESDWQFAMSNQ